MPPDESNTLSPARNGPLPGLPVSSGNVSRVFQAAADAIRAGTESALAVVLECEGSTYATPGTLAFFGAGGHVGWISGGCLEPEIDRRAMEVASMGRIGWLEIDTRDDDALLAGAATGCRGRQRLCLLPLGVLVGCDALLDRWQNGHCDLLLHVGQDGVVEMTIDAMTRRWRLPLAPVEWSPQAQTWSRFILRPPEVLVLGVGPETRTLVPLLRDLGWRVTAADRRPRWRNSSAMSADIMDATPAQALGSDPDFDAVLVMHHNFELDHEALTALVTSPARFIGLLGPLGRREDLFKLLAPAQRASLLPRLRSPVGIRLGGQGPEAIALSIAAQLQEWRHSAET